MINPWGDYIAVTDPPAEEQDGTYKGTGLVLPPETNLDVLSKGIVIGVGPAAEEGAPDGFRPGAVVWYPHGTAVEIGEGDQAVKFVRSGSLIAWEAS